MKVRSSGYGRPPFTHRLTHAPQPIPTSIDRAAGVVIALSYLDTRQKVTFGVIIMFLSALRKAKGACHWP